MIVKLLTEHHMAFLSLKGGCTGSSESTLVKMSNCWKSHATAHQKECKELWFLHMTHRLFVLYNCMKFHPNSLKKSFNLN